MASTITNADLMKCSYIGDLLTLLVYRTINRIFEESDSGFVDMLSIYRWAAANKVCDTHHLSRYLCESNPVTSLLILQASRHTELLEAFTARQSGDIRGDLATEGAEELNLILEVVDILDELNILMLLLEKQTEVVDDLRLKAWPLRDLLFKEYSSYELMGHANDRLEAKKVETARLHGDVSQTHKLVSFLGAESAILKRIRSLCGQFV